MSTIFFISFFKTRFECDLLVRKGWAAYQATPVALALAADAIADGRIGLPEAVYILQKVAEMRSK